MWFRFALASTFLYVLIFMLGKVSVTASVRKSFERCPVYNGILEVSLLVTEKLLPEIWVGTKKGNNEFPSAALGERINQFSLEQRRYFVAVPYWQRISDDKRFVPSESLVNIVFSITQISLEPTVNMLEDSCSRSSDTSQEHQNLVEFYSLPITFKPVQ